ncbi:MAG TPA: hypothetical protein VGM21_09160 [Actinomycetota bacterium]
MASPTTARRDASASSVPPNCLKSKKMVVSASPSSSGSSIHARK